MEEVQDVLSTTLAPPVLGWNAKDPISQMDPLYAVEMENYFPNNSTVDFVNGYRQHAKGVGLGVVYGLKSFVFADGTTGESNYKLVASGDDNSVYDATSTGSATDITGAVSFTQPPIYFCQFRDRLFVSNGVLSDPLAYWTGTGTLTDSGASSSYGYGPMVVYKSRLYSALKRTSEKYVGYSDSPTSYSLTKYWNYDSLVTLGGRAIFLAILTRAKDFNEDELFCLVTDQGEVLVYEGDWPEAANWRRVGRYIIPRPLGPKAFYYIGANLCIITTQGVIPMSEVMGGTATGKYLGLSDSINPKFREAATSALLNNWAWCGVSYPRGNFAVNNIPVTNEEVSHQYYMNLQTQAWCKRSGQNAFCWEIHNDELYFGAINGKVCKADTGDFDEDYIEEGVATNRITVLRWAPNYLDNRQSIKSMQMAVPILYESEGLQISLEANMDYREDFPSNDVLDLSDLSYKQYRPTIGLSGEGKAVSLHFAQNILEKKRSLQAVEIFWTEGGSFG